MADENSKIINDLLDRIKVTDENGVIWDSTTEYKYGLKLKELQEKGVIKDLQRQVPYLLIPAFKDGQGNSVRKTEYVADFVLERFLAFGAIEREDVNPDSHAVNVFNAILHNPCLAV